MKKLNHKPRVLIFEASDKWGGIESYIHNELLPLSSEFEFFLIAVGTTPEMLRRFGLSRDHVFKISPCDNAITRVQETTAILRDNDFDIIYFNKNSAVKFWPIVLASHLSTAKIIIHSHNTQPSRPGIGKFLHYLCRPITRKFADAKIACSREAAEYMFDSSDDVTTVPNGIDIQRYTFSQKDRIEVREQLGIDTNSKVFINVGRLSKQKNQSFLLPIFKDYIYSYPDSYLLLLGVGEQQNVLRSQIADMGLQSHVLMLGSKDDIFRYYSAADCFVFPSIYEGLGIVLVEAQTNGLPCIASAAVPREVKVLPCVKFLELQPDKWLHAMESMGKQHLNDTLRLSYGDQMEKSRYNQEKCVNKVRAILRELVMR